MEDYKAHNTCFVNKLHFSQDQLVQVARLSKADIAVIEECRSPQTKLGLGYQLAFVRLFNQFPLQVPFEPLDDIVTYMSLQLDISSELIEQYKKRRQTIAEHRKRIQEYLQLKPFHPEGVQLLDGFLYKEALQIEPTDSLLVKATHFLRDNHILNPAEDTLRGTIYEQRKKARRYIFETINVLLSPSLKERLDLLLQTGEQTVSAFHRIKDAPQKPSEAGMKLLSAKLDLIKQTGALTINLGWLNNNYKRYLSNYAIACDAHKLRELTPMQCCRLAKGGGRKLWRLAPSAPTSFAQCSHPIRVWEGQNLYDLKNIFPAPYASLRRRRTLANRL
jgi:Domain of unknown function (DUF4158)